MTMPAASGSSHRHTGMWPLLGIVSVWSIPVAMGIVVAAPFGVTDARVMVGELLGDSSARYLGYCTMPLAIYSFSALLIHATEAPCAGSPTGCLRSPGAMVRADVPGSRTRCRFAVR